MPAIAEVSLALGIPLVALALVVWHRRWRGRMAAALALVAVGVAAAAEVAAPLELLSLPGWTGLDYGVAWLGSWALFSAGAALAVRRLPGGPPAAVALILGACMGELAAALVLGRHARDGAAAARLALTAAAGALIGRVGDPVLGLNADSSLLGWAPLWLAVAIGVVVARPRAADLASRGEEGSLAPLGVCLFGAVGATIMPAWGPVILGLVGLMLVALGARRPGRGPALELVLWVGASVVLVVLATAAGLPEVAAWGLEEAQELPGVLAGPLLGGLSLVFATLVDGPAAALFLDATLARALELRLPGGAQFAALGAGVGGLGPLVIAGGLRAGWWRWLLTALLTCVLWAAFVVWG